MKNMKYETGSEWSELLNSFSAIWSHSSAVPWNVDIVNCTSSMMPTSSVGIKCYHEDGLVHSKIGLWWMFAP